MFCGRLEACFRGQTVVSIACSCSVLAKPCKSRTFQLLTVHTRPPFPFTFCFLSPVNSGGTARTVFCPVGFWDEHAAADLTAFQVLSPENLCFQRSALRQDRPAEPLAADGECDHLRAGAGVTIVQRKAVAAVTVAALPAYQAAGPFPLRRGHAVGGAVLLALYGWQSFIWVLSHVFPPFCFPLPFSPKRLPASSSQAAYRSFHRKRQNSLAPLLLLSPQSHATLRGPRQWRRVPALARSPDFGTFCPEVTSGQSVQKLAPCGASPAGVFIFGRSFIFQGAAHR